MDVFILMLFGLSLVANVLAVREIERLRLSVNLHRSRGGLLARQLRLMHIIQTNPKPFIVAFAGDDVAMRGQSDNPGLDFAAPFDPRTMPGNATATEAALPKGWRG